MLTRYPTSCKTDLIISQTCACRWFIGYQTSCEHEKPAKTVHLSGTMNTALSLPTDCLRAWEGGDGGMWGIFEKPWKRPVCLLAALMVWQKLWSGLEGSCP